MNTLGCFSDWSYYSISFKGKLHVNKNRILYLELIFSFYYTAYEFLLFASHTSVIMFYKNGDFSALSRFKQAKSISQPKLTPRVSYGTITAKSYFSHFVLKLFT